jgi:hypothetical protein
MEQPGTHYHRTVSRDPLSGHCERRDAISLSVLTCSKDRVAALAMTDGSR